MTLGTESAFASASRYLLKLDGVAGELDFDKESWFEVNSFSFDIEGAGRDAEKATFSPLTLTLDSNTALAPLLTMAATGQHFETATLVGMRADGEPITYQLDLRAVFVTKVEDIAGAGLSVNLDFGAIKLQPFTQDEIGVVRQAPSDFRWNLATNTEDFGVVDISGAEPSTAASMPSMAQQHVGHIHRGDPLSPEPATYFMLIDGLNGGSADLAQRLVRDLQPRFRSCKPGQYWLRQRRRRQHTAKRISRF